MYSGFSGKALLKQCVTSSGVPDFILTPSPNLPLSKECKHMSKSKNYRKKQWMMGNSHSMTKNMWNIGDLG